MKRGSVVSMSDTDPKGDSGVVHSTNKRTLSKEDLVDRVRLAVEVSKEAGELRSIAFERILEALLRPGGNVLVELPKEADVGGLETKPPAAPPSSAAAPSAHASFFERHKVPLARLEELIELKTGQIIAVDLGDTITERHRKIAALIAARNAALSGQLTVPADQLKSQCEAFSIYDTDNTSTYVRKTEFGGARVFLREGKGYKVSRPGEGYVASVLSQLLGLSSRESSSKK